MWTACNYQEGREWKTTGHAMFPMQTATHALTGRLSLWTTTTTASQIAKTSTVVTILWHATTMRRSPSTTGLAMCPIRSAKRVWMASSVDVDTDGDGILDCNEILGCTDTSAINYDSFATESVNDTCIIYGCTYEEACNYNPAATIDDGTCETVSCAGCTDPLACDYDPEKTFDDGTCEFTSCAGCTDPSQLATTRTTRPLTTAHASMLTWCLRWKWHPRGCL